MAQENIMGGTMDKAKSTKSKQTQTFEVEARTSYLIEESKPLISFQMFDSEVKKDRKALCITRKNPMKLREQYNWKNLSIIWLTRNNLETEHCIDPTNISRLSMEIANFIKESKDGVILLEGLEYLISQNSYQIILHFIQLINDKIMLSNCTIIVTMDPLILNERELHLLERDMKLPEF
jgi:two-component system cell cycle response regulator